MNRKKKCLKTLGLFVLTICLVGGITFAATVAYYKWNGGLTAASTIEYIKASKIKMLQLKAELDDALSGNTVVELEKVIVILNEEVSKANADATSIRATLNSALEELVAEGIDLGIDPVETPSSEDTVFTNP